MKDKGAYRLNGQNNESFVMPAVSVQNTCIDDVTVGITTTELTCSSDITHRKGNDKLEEKVDEATGNDYGKGVVIETVEQPLVYNVSDWIPPHLTMLFAMQQALLALSASIASSIFVSQVVCAENNDEIRAKLLSSTLFMNGITTLLMVTVGIRLPLYQGSSADYVAPLLAMADLEKDRCNFLKTDTIGNITDVNDTGISSNITEVNHEEIIFRYIASLQGSLMAAGAIHFIIGATGLVGVLLRFIGPITIVPTILLVGIFLVKSVTGFAQYHWGISLMTAGIAIILSLYLANVKMPIPVWTRKKSFHIIRYPLHQVFAILIALVIGWLFCLVLTVSGVLSNDPQSNEFKARTDSRLEVISKATWFYFPYPGQFGEIGFSISAFVGFLVATIVSILDSIGDYYACASTCRVPPPPSHGVNRGIAIEGFCTVLSGAVGCGHATTTYGGNVGAVGLTRVASRWVFVGVAVIYIIFGVIGKFSAIFITIPYPVLGGVLIVLLGAFNGVVLSNLKAVDMSSTRNLTIIGISLLLGLMVPNWVADYPNVINTGNAEADHVITLLLGNPNLCGGLIACFLDNTVPGTLKERGISAWQMSEITPEDESKFAEGFEVYEPILPKRIKQMKIMKYLPFMPNPKESEDFK